MRRLLAFFIVFLAPLLTLSSSHHLIVLRYFIKTFTNDGSFYRFDPSSQKVDWVNSLDFQLLSLNIVRDSFNDENETRTFLIPTIDGDFLFIDEGIHQNRMKEIVIARKDVEELLDICFQNKEYQNYFVYEKLEYLVLNLQNGQTVPLEEFFKSKKVLNRKSHHIMIIQKKLLKQMNFQMKVKWSIISSTVSLVNPDDFVKNPKLNQLPKRLSSYSFYRRGPKTIQIEDIKEGNTFEITSESPILSMFMVSSQNQVSKIQILQSQLNMLALQAKPFGENLKTFGELETFENNPNYSFENFPHSSEFKDTWKNDDSDIAFCVNSFRIMKEMYGERTPEFIGKMKSSEEEKIKQVPTIPFSYDKRSHVYIPKEQPFAELVLAIIIVAILIFSYIFVKTDKMKKLISDLNEQNDEKLNEIKKKLGQYENAGKQLKKMYEVNWKKMLINRGNYCVFEGRFLNQLANVYALPINGNDTISIEHELNSLINCSHRNISKLYYYTQNEDYLLIFSEANPSTNTLTDINEFQKNQFEKKSQVYTLFIKNIVESLVYLMKNNIQLNSLVTDSIELNETNFYKINIIPSLLEKNDESMEERLKELGTNYTRFNLVQIIHYIGHKCEQFDIQQFEKQKNTEEEEHFFLKDFYDFILTGQGEEKKNEKDEENQSNLRQIISHPYLWDSKQKMLFISDFSNYLETNLDETKVGKMQAHCKNHNIIIVPWNKELHHLLMKEMNHFRKYDYYSVRDLIRLIRNKVSHYHELPKETKAALGKTPEQFVEYFLEKFPKLLAFMHIYAQKKKWKLHIQ